MVMYLIAIPTVLLIIEIYMHTIFVWGYCACSVSVRLCDSLHHLNKLCGKLHVSLTPRSPSLNCLLLWFVCLFNCKQTPANGDSNCFDLYQIEAVPSTQGDTLTQGPLIPTVTPGTNGQEHTISLTLDSGLNVNQVYNVSITAMNVIGENTSTGSIQFSKYIHITVILLC